MKKKYYNDAFIGNKDVIASVENYLEYIIHHQTICNIVIITM